MEDMLHWCYEVCRRLKVSLRLKTNILYVFSLHSLLEVRGIFRKWEGIVGTGWSGLRIGTGGGHL
jgi:hypothetical protein